MKNYKRRKNATINIMNEDYHDYFDYYEDFYNDHYDFDKMIDYDYYGNDSDVFDNFFVVRKNRIRLNRNFIDTGKKIDMLSFYGKDKKREKRIESILGNIDELDNTIENIINSKGIKIY